MQISWRNGKNVDKERIGSTALIASFVSRKKVSKYLNIKMKKDKLLITVKILDIRKLRNSKKIYTKNKRKKYL